MQSFVIATRENGRFASATNSDFRSIFADVALQSLIRETQRAVPQFDRQAKSLATAIQPLRLYGEPGCGLANGEQSVFMIWRLRVPIQKSQRGQQGTLRRSALRQERRDRFGRQSSSAQRFARKVLDRYLHRIYPPHFQFPPAEFVRLLTARTRHPLFLFVFIRPLQRSVPDGRFCQQPTACRSARRRSYPAATFPAEPNSLR